MKMPDYLLFIYNYISKNRHELIFDGNENWKLLDSKFLYILNILHVKWDRLLKIMCLSRNAFEMAFRWTDF